MAETEEDIIDDVSSLLMGANAKTRGRVKSIVGSNDHIIPDDVAIGPATFPADMVTMALEELCERRYSNLSEMEGVFLESIDHNKRRAEFGGSSFVFLPWNELVECLYDVADRHGDFFPFDFGGEDQRSLTKLVMSNSNLQKTLYLMLENEGFFWEAMAEEVDWMSILQTQIMPEIGKHLGRAAELHGKTPYVFGPDDGGHDVNNKGVLVKSLVNVHISF